MIDTTNPTFLMAALVAIASAGVFAIRYVKPAASRDYDIIFAVAGLIYAICLGWEGWRLIPLLYFAQVLVVAVGAFFAVETFRLRLQVVEKSRQLQGKSGPERFTRTYKPRDPNVRTVPSSGSGDRRIRERAEYSRTIESREERRRPSGPRPQLEAPARPRRSSQPPDLDPEETYYDEPGSRSQRDYPEAGRSDDRAEGKSGGRRPPRLPDEEYERPSPRRIIQVEPLDDEDGEES